MYNSAQSTYESLIDLAVSAAMANCRSMTNEQLSAMLDNDQLLTSLIDSLPQVRSMPTDKESALASNKSLAEWNLAQKPRIDTVKSLTISLYEQAKQLKDEVNQLKQQLDSASSSKSLDTTSNLMQVAAQEADEDAEAVFRQFEDGEIPIDIFLKSFKEKKAVAHLRKIKADRLAAILREQTYSTIESRGLPNAPSVSQPSYPSINTMPGFGSGYPGYSNSNSGNRHPFF